MGERNIPNQPRSRHSDTAAHPKPQPSSLNESDGVSIQGENPADAVEGKKTIEFLDQQNSGKEVSGAEDDVEAEVCFICASIVIHNAVAPCNHRTCHICALRLRALYKTRACAHCRVSPFPF